MFSGKYFSPLWLAQNNVHECDEYKPTLSKSCSPLHKTQLGWANLRNLRLHSLFVNSVVTFLTTFGKLIHHRPACQRWPMNEIETGVHEPQGILLGPFGQSNGCCAAEVSHDSLVGEWLDLTVCPSCGPGSILGHNGEIQGIFPWLITLCQPALSQHGREWLNLPSMTPHRLWTMARKTKTQLQTDKGWIKKSKRRLWPSSANLSRF